MDLIEFSEKISPIPLTEYQKKILKMYEKVCREGKELSVCYPPRVGIRMITDIVNRFEEQNKPM